MELGRPFRDLERNDLTGRKNNRVTLIEHREPAMNPEISLEILSFRERHETLVNIIILFQPWRANVSLISGVS